MVTLECRTDSKMGLEWKILVLVMFATIIIAQITTYRTSKKIKPDKEMSVYWEILIITPTDFFLSPKGGEKT